MNFKEFLIESNLSDVHKTLRKLPNSHSELVKGYKFLFTGGNTLQGDNQHVGVIDSKNKTITIAAPWEFSREYTLLHEIGHKVWDILSKKQKNEWINIAKNTKNKSEKDPEELFCFSYAKYYASDKPGQYHDHNTWTQFMKKTFGSSSRESQK